MFFVYFWILKFPFATRGAFSLTLTGTRMARDGQVTSLRKLSGNALPCQGFSINNNIFDVQI